MQEFDLERRELLAAGALAAGALLATAGGEAATQPALPPKLSTHALGTYTGKQAAGIRLDLHDARQAHHLPFQITPWTQSSGVLPG